MGEGCTHSETNWWVSDRAWEVERGRVLEVMWWDMVGVQFVWMAPLPGSLHTFLGWSPLQCSCLRTPLWLHGCCCW